MQKSTKLSIILTICSLILCVYSIFSAKKTIEVQAERVTCTAIGNYDEAQKIYQSDTKKYKALDRNQDGIACNDLK